MSDDPQPVEIDPNNPGGLLQEVVVKEEDPATKETLPLPELAAPVISDSAWEAALATWINARVRNSPISGATEAWNHLMGALPYLRTCLNNELKAKE